MTKQKKWIHKHAIANWPRTEMDNPQGDVKKR